ncbi:DUF554 domain-containing protein [Lapidilactobacillus luobeiensis]|uniref:DUF554 domain-containing protein n=1 Tax=Lapidilactobacillus luobeiensis TaxID=2950371 RepID=UPI0021C290FC|nr:DUF554 domain-containing protein [Lapidilactobacillus luobeiensis]
MWGTFFNVGMILVGSLVGTFFKRGLRPDFHEILMQALGLAAVGLGINAVVQQLPKSKYPVLFIVSLAVGGVLGQWLDLETRFDRLVRKYSHSDLATGLSTAILLFCMGTLAIVGPIEAALKHDYTLLLTNGILDGITSLVLASTFGLGIAFVAVVVFLWQGGIYLLALLFQNAISQTLLTEIMIVGGLLILASGLSILNIKKFKTMNLLPALLIPPLVLGIISLF